jgi:hypothetical protein
VNICWKYLMINQFSSVSWPLNSRLSRGVALGEPNLLLKAMIAGSSLVPRSLF